MYNSTQRRKELLSELKKIFMECTEKANAENGHSMRMQSKKCAFPTQAFNQILVLVVTNRVSSSYCGHFGYKQMDWTTKHMPFKHSIVNYCHWTVFSRADKWSIIKPSDQGSIICKWNVCRL